MTHYINVWEEVFRSILHLFIYLFFSEVISAIMNNVT